MNISNLNKFIAEFKKSNRKFDIEDGKFCICGHLNHFMNKNDEIGYKFGSAFLNISKDEYDDLKWNYRKNIIKKEAIQHLENMVKQKKFIPWCDFDPDFQVDEKPEQFRIQLEGKSLNKIEEDIEFFKTKRFYCLTREQYKNDENDLEDLVEFDFYDFEDDLIHTGVGDVFSEDELGFNSSKDSDYVLVLMNEWKKYVEHLVKYNFPVILQMKTDSNYKALFLSKTKAKYITTKNGFNSHNNMKSVDLEIWELHNQILDGGDDE